ncbi:ABC transporter permease [Candidatus Bipolaricaulota bacterium]|nr:ABC transporter permease [Candidatus Bipolaricaulota bacterium]
MKKFFVRLFRMREVGVLLALILIMLFFGFYTSTFFTAKNLTNVLRQSSVLGIMAMAVTLLMISGEFDLSIGSTFAFSSIVCVVMMESGVPATLAFFLALLMAAAIGLINGLLVTKARLPSFIATLGMMMVVRSLVLITGSGRPRVLGDRGLIGEVMGGGTLFGAIPVPIVWLLVVVAVGWVLLSKTTFGYKAYATGGNIHAAKLSGINTDRVKIINFILTSFAAGFAGIISLCFLRMVAPVQGAGYELEAIAASVIGGTALWGGIGSVFGAFLGSFILAVIRNGLVLMRTNPYWQNGVLGAVILAAVVVNIRLGAARRGGPRIRFLKRGRRAELPQAAAQPADDSKSNERLQEKGRK